MTAQPCSTALALTRFHRARLMQIWRSAGWPCKDGLEIDLLAAGLVELRVAADGHESLRLTDAGIATLAQARQRGVRALSLHDRLGQRFASQLMSTGRIVWTELSLRALVDGGPSPLPTDAPAPPQPAASLWADDADPPPAAAHVWRMARPDLFSVRNTSVPAYLQPMVHEIKASRADLLSDLRHDAKRQAYQWLCEECYYVFPAGIAEPQEIPEHFGVWVLHGSVDDGRFELLRPARHNRCTLPFAVWMALCKATPLRDEEEAAQAHLGNPAADAAVWTPNATADTGRSGAGAPCATTP